MRNVPEKRTFLKQGITGKNFLLPLQDFSYGVDKHTL